VSVAVLGELLPRAAQVERRQFEERNGRQVPGEFGNWPELFDAAVAPV
jgi:hypothetical protein